MLGRLQDPPHVQERRACGGRRVCVYHPSPARSKIGAPRRHVGLPQTPAHARPTLPAVQAVHAPPLLPDLQHPDLVASHAPEWCDGVDVRFEKAGSVPPPGSETAGLADPLVGFFGWVAAISRQAPHHETLAVRSRGVGSFRLPRASCGWHRLASNPLKKEEESVFRISLEDPFET